MNHLKIDLQKKIEEKRNITKRNLWCKEYSKFSQSDWKEVIFSDEVRIKMHSTRRRYVRRRHGDFLKFRYVLKNRKICRL